MKQYNKLVRDRIPEIIQSKGGEARIRVLSSEEYADCLKNKLNEEVNEFMQDRTVEELADICEVIRAILENMGISYESFEALRKQKAKERGAFSKRIFLEYVIE